MFTVVELEDIRCALEDRRGYCTEQHNAYTKENNDCRALYWKQERDAVKALMNKVDAAILALETSEKL